MQPTGWRSAEYGPNIALCCWRRYSVSLSGRYVRCAGWPPRSRLKAMADLVAQRAQPLKPAFSPPSVAAQIVRMSPPSQSGFGVSLAIRLDTFLPSPDCEGGDSFAEKSLTRAERRRGKAERVQSHDILYTRSQEILYTAGIVECPLGRASWLGE